MSTLNQFLGGGGIKSIQSGSTEFVGTAVFPNLERRTIQAIPINPVVKSKSVVIATVAGDPITGDYYDSITGSYVAPYFINSNASIKLELGVPSFVNSTISLESQSQTLTGLESGDLVLLFYSDDDGNLPSSITGWSKLPFDQDNPDNDNSPSTSGFYKFADSSSVQVNSIPSNTNAMMVAFRNIDSSDPFDVNTIPKNVLGSGMPDPPSTTTVTDNCMIVAVGFLDNDRAITASTIPPFGYTLANVTSAADSSTILVAYKNLKSAGDEDPSAFRSSDDNNNNDANKAYTIALKPITTNATSSSLVITVGGALRDVYEIPGGASNQSGIIDWQVIEYE